MSDDLPSPVSFTIPAPRVAIETLDRSRFDTALVTLTRAFDRDPMFTWIFPDPVVRARSLRAMNHVPLEYGLRFGVVTTAAHGGALAIWLPPEQRISVRGMIRAGMLGMPWSMGIGPFLTFMRANDAMGTLHAACVPEPHWYLLIVAVDPSLQGRGLGTALLRHGLARADASGTPCYLETSHPSNLPFYERHGFVVAATTPLGRGGPPGWAMRREPQGGGA